MEAALPDDRRIDLWYVRSDAIADPALVDEYRRLLAPEELAQEQRLKFEVDRIQHVVARALVRTVLSRYAGMEPGGLKFALNAFGKPRLAGPFPPPLEFNLSHTPGLVVCLVATRREVGVDAEDLSRSADHLTLARRFFAPAEVAALEALPPAEQGAAFFRFWTFKEAYVKARGLGLSLGLEDFAFVLSDEQPPRITFVPKVGDDPARWQFAELRLADRYQVAMAVRSPAAEPLTVGVHEVVPLRREDGGQALPPVATNRWAL